MTEMNRSIRSQRGLSAASRRSYNSMAGGSNNANVRDRYKADYPNGDPDFDKMPSSHSN